MSTDETIDYEEPLDSLLLAYQDALLTNAPLPALGSADMPPELRHRLERNLACMQLLRQLLPRGQAAGTFPAGPQETTVDPAVDSSQPVTHLGRFRIRRELGRGGFGIVLLADDPLLGRPVALKIPLPDALLKPNLRDRFLREARAAAGLDHPNLVPVYEAGEVGPVCYIASAYCPGTNLAVWLKQQDQDVPARTAAALVAAVAEAVQHAHGRGILHRDLKPSNILLVPRPAEGPVGPPDELRFIPKLTDFGLAKLLQEHEHETTTGVIVGTPEYMAPEQAEGARGRMGAQTDVYALGVILYELLTGQVPFRGTNLLHTLEQVRSEEPVPPRQLRPQLPRDLETICLQCLRKDPYERYVSASALVQDLRHFLQSEPIQARPLSLLALGRSWCRRPERILDAGVIALLIGLISIANIVVGLIFITGGFFQPDKSVALVRHFVLTFCILGLPMFWVCYHTWRRRALALWTGSLLAPVYTIYMGAVGGFDSMNTGGMVSNRDTLLQLGLTFMALILLLVQFVAYLVALVAYYSNRKTTDIAL